MSRPEDRYVSLETKTLSDGRTVYKPAIPIAVVGDPLNDLSFPASAYDRLDIMANNVYGSPLDWWRIASANGIVNGGLFVKPGTTLVIPQG